MAIRNEMFVEVAKEVSRERDDHRRPRIVAAVEQHRIAWKALLELVSSGHLFSGAADSRSAGEAAALLPANRKASPCPGETLRRAIAVL